MNQGIQIYAFDTSALIDGLERYYAIENFPGLWEQIDELISLKRIAVSEEVWEETKAKDLPAKEWLEPRLGEVIIPTDAAMTSQVTRILDEYPKLVKAGSTRNRADAFVVAAASICPAVVVTGEGSDGNINRPKIPFICQNYGIDCISFSGLIRREGWRF